MFKLTDNQLNTNTLTQLPTTGFYSWCNSEDNTQLNKISHGAN